MCSAPSLHGAHQRAPLGHGDDFDLLEGVVGPAARGLYCLAWQRVRIPHGGTVPVTSALMLWVQYIWVQYIQALAPVAPPALLGAALTGLVSYLIYKRGVHERIARELLSEGLAIQALEEAWIVQGYDESEVEKIKIHEHPNLREEKEKEPGSRVWLRRVEVRAVLDEAYWNSPQTKPYGFIGTRRAWIVRNEIGKGKHSGPTPTHYPALMSSRGREELCGWIERVRTAYAGRALRRRDLEMLRPLLGRLMHEDILENLRDGLTKEVPNFLARMRRRCRPPKVSGNGGP